MIESLLYAALGFTIASLLALLIAPAAWRRAVRLTERRIAATMPVSPADIRADKDLLRAENAVEIRRLEIELEKARGKAARHLMERNRHMVEMGELREEIARLKRTVDERKQAATVLEQNVQRGIPALEAKLEKANQVIAARERELVERARAYANQTEALEMAQDAIRRQGQEIDRLRAALESGSFSGAKWPFGQAAEKDEQVAELEKDYGQVLAELSRLREELTELKEVDAVRSEELRASLNQLADEMLNAPSAPPSDKPAAATAPGPDAEKKQKVAKPKKRTSRRRKAKTEGSLSKRIAGLKDKDRKQTEDA